MLDLKITINNSLHFGLLTLAPKFRGKNIAKNVIISIEEFAKNNKCKIVELDYMSIAPRLKKYYENYGFTQSGEVEEWKSIKLIRMNKMI